MQRVVVVGPGGAGKSTFARRLGGRTGLPVIHLDEHFWHPGWTETPSDEWTALQDGLVAADRWIIEGNYGGTFDVRFERADTVVVLMPSRWRCIAGASSRMLRNYGRAVQAAGCPERFSFEFLRWIWRYPLDSRPRLDGALRRHQGHLDVVELNSRQAAEDYLDRVAGSPAPSTA